MKTYLCKNAACALGSMKDHGRFTGGITKDQATLLTGDPEPEYGQGVCPNCGVKAEEFSSTKAIKGAIAEAEAQHKERLAAIRKEMA